MNRLTLVILLLIPLWGVAQMPSEKYFSGEGLRNMKRIAKEKVKLWIEINEKRYDCLEKTKIGRLKYIPAECSDGYYIGEIKEGKEGIDLACSLYYLEVSCINDNRMIYKYIGFSFSIYGEFCDIVIYDYETNTYSTIFP